MLVWEYVWYLFCIWTPKPCNKWRLFWLRAFGAKVSGSPFVHQRARIQIPWNVTLKERSCLGDRSSIYSLGRIVIDEGAIVAQEAYLCGGTHGFDEMGLPLVTGDICVGKDAFVGARAFVLPNITIGEGAIVGACSVVCSDVEPFTVNAGNPCRLLSRRRRFVVT